MQTILTWCRMRLALPTEERVALSVPCQSLQDLTWVLTVSVVLLVVLVNLFTLLFYRLT